MSFRNQSQQHLQPLRVSSMKSISIINLQKSIHNDFTKHHPNLKSSLSLSNKLNHKFIPFVNQRKLGKLITKSQTKLDLSKNKPIAFSEYESIIDSKMLQQKQFNSKHLNLKKFNSFYTKVRKQLDGVYSHLTRRSMQQDLVNTSVNRGWVKVGIQKGSFKNNNSSLNNSKIVNHSKAIQKNKHPNKPKNKNHQLSKMDEVFCKKIIKNIPPDQIKNPQTLHLFETYAKACQFNENIRRRQLVGKLF